MTNPARDEAFILARSAALSRAWLRNLLRAQRVLVCEARPRRGTAVIVGAGPSLDLAAVRDAQARGAAVWTVNTALPALASAGVVPDVCVTRELVDLSEQLRHPHGVLVADIGARPESVPDGAVWVVPRSAALRDVARALAIETVDCGPSAITQAIALASLSAARVELHGVDCCYANDGATYHPASGFGDRVATLDGTEVTYAGAGHDAKRAAHERSRVGATMSRETVHEVQLRRGDTALATGDLIEQREWMEQHAANGRLGDTVYVDASGGARKLGWLDVENITALSAIYRPDPCEPLAAMALDDMDRAAVRAAILREANYLGHVAVNVVHPDGDPGAIPPVPAGIARSLCAAEMLRIRRTNASHAQVLRAQYATWARAADEVAAALGVESSCAADYERAVGLMGTREAQQTSLVSLAIALSNIAEQSSYDDRSAYETAADAVANVAQRAILLGSSSL